KDARRSVYFHPRPEYEALNAARARMNDPEWQERHHVRAGGGGRRCQGGGREGAPRQGGRTSARRGSRYIGLAKTGLQQACAAAAMNVLRAMHWLAGVTRAKTRHTRFAGRGPAAG